jgi:hypothetical protein
MGVLVMLVRRRLRERGQRGGAQQEGEGEGGSFHHVLLVAARAARRAMCASCIRIVEKK